MKRTLLVAAFAAMMVFGMVAAAQANTSAAVTVTATINTKLLLTVPLGKDWGAFAPDAASPAAYLGTVTVQSNADYTLARTVDDHFNAGMMSVPLAPKMDGTNVTHTGIVQTYPQTWTLTLAPGGVWQDPKAYWATYTYTTTPN